MALSQKQSPQQVLLSTLLQLPVLRLEQRISQELEMNPLLELEMEEDMEQDEELSQVEDEKEEEDEEEQNEIPEEETKIDWDEILNDEDNYEIKAPRERPEEEMDRPEAAPVTLMDHLMEQIHLSPLNDYEQEIGEYILWSIDGTGYLKTDLESIAENFEESVELIEYVLSVIQGFDPIGIGARNLQECLLIQLRSEPDPDENAIRMVTECFEDFTNKRYEKVAKKLEIDLEEVKRIMEMVSHLNPKPGQSFAVEASAAIVPDVIVIQEGNEFTIHLNDWNIPRLRINESYRRLLKDKREVNKETRDYIRQRLESARWLINSIYQRRSTIQRVMESIVKHQKGFFLKGAEFLKPMILKDIAEDVGLDISTVSRVTSGKYVQTDNGILELKYFFSERMETADGDDVSNKLIKQKIKDIIGKENTKKPLNDQTISEMLTKEGYIVARRTVAKYREQMQLPVARLRREI
ncbi:RNA polymerase factor sigma-54 [candidate division KSB1 bacterium]|nr:RNA polymerase factor sigma-54 [candidate division KSB1 bacterium]